ncbi:MAG TPA: hypothetical protein VF069_00945 [Streptosporangiaceae bacterium]
MSAVTAARPVRGMLWVAWRQHRMMAAGVVAVLGGLALALFVHGLGMHADFVRLGLDRCGSPAGGRCQALEPFFDDQYGGALLYWPRLLLFLPMLIGMFAGAPLVARELESGTFRFAWTQGCGRLRWILVKLAAIAVVLTVAALGFSLVYAWWFEPAASFQGRLGNGTYEVSGLVFTARLVLGFALGVLLGVLIRRTIVAMAATLLGQLAISLPLALVLRPRIERPITTRLGPGHDPTGWTLHQWWVGPDGHRVGRATMSALANRLEVGGVEPYRWLAAHHYAQWETYQPDGRFWTFQLVESGCLVVLAGACAAAAVWWIVRKAT